jgi:hypothetical protein
MRDLLDLQRGQIVGAHLAGTSVTKMATSLGVSRAAVSKVMTAYKNPSKTSSSMRNYLFYFIIFSGSAAQRGLWPPHSRGFLITHSDAPQSVGLLDEQSARRRDFYLTTHNKHPCPQWDLNPRLQQSTGRRHTP